MKQHLTLLVFFMLFSLTLFAQEPIEQSVEPIKIDEAQLSNVINREPTQEPMEQKNPSLSQLIKEIQGAKADKRRLLMNALKVRLRAENKTHRQEAILALKKAFTHHDSERETKSHLHMKMHSKTNNCNQHQEQSMHQPKFRHLEHQMSVQERENRQSQNGQRNNPIHNPRGADKK